MDLTRRHNIVEEINNHYSYSLFEVYLQSDGVWKGERQPAHRGLHYPGRQQIDTFLIQKIRILNFWTFLRGIMGWGGGKGDIEASTTPPNIDYTFTTCRKSQ